MSAVTDSGDNIVATRKIALITGITGQVCF